MTRAVLFDFAGTLLFPGSREAWLQGAADAAGFAVHPADVAGHAEALEATGGRPGGREPVALAGEQARDWEGRDLSAAAHRRVYTSLLAPAVDALAGAGSPLLSALYDRSTSPADWVPYADTIAVLTGLRERDVRVAVVSNVGFDLPPVLAGHGVLALVDTVVESFREGLMKPHPDLFALALERLGVPAADALMVGDNPVADAGAAAAGIPTLLLPVTPAGSVHGLAAVLGIVDALAGAVPGAAVPAAASP